MDILWHGKTCFTIKGKDAVIVINPDKSIKTPLKGDIVLSSIGGKEDLAEVQGAKKIFDWAGEYEISDIPIVGMNAWTRSRSTEEEAGEKGDRTIIFGMGVDKFKIYHLGGLGHKLTTEMVEDIGDVDVLMVPVGYESNLGGDKMEDVIDQIEPRMVVFMGSGDRQAAAKKLSGTVPVEEQEKLTINSREALPDDKTIYTILKAV